MKKPIKIKQDSIVKLSSREKEVRDGIVDFVSKNWESAQDLFERCSEENPEGALKILVALTEFVAPRYARAKAPEPEDKHTDIVVTFRREEQIDSQHEQD
jgi:hypothetical protein